MCLQIIYTYLMYMFQKDLSLNKITYNGWYAIKSNPTKSYIFDIYVLSGFVIK